MKTIRFFEGADGTNFVTLPLLIVAVILLLAVLLALILWSVKRRTRPRLGFKTEAGVRDLLSSFAGITQSTLTEGNSIEMLQNGAFFDALYDDIEKAKESITFTTFLCKEGKVTRHVARLLTKKAKEGVEVRMLLDANGSRKFGKEDLRKMREAGCRIASYHPLRLSNLGKINTRDHRKIAVFDARIGYVGGHCLVDTWLGEAKNKKQFRDISVRVEGPVVGQLQSAILENWIEETGEIPAGPQMFCDVEKKGKSIAYAVYLSTHGSPSTVELLHYMAIAGARERITIQNPYFLPDPDARRALLDAVRRGVEVRVMLPAASATDSPIVQHASHHHYGTLLKGGIRIFEYQRTLLHQKVITIDGCWSAIGSTNFDDRAFEINEEISLGIYDKAIAGELEETFDRDAEDAREMEFDAWARRPWHHKLLDGFVFLFNEQL